MLRATRRCSPSPPLVARRRSYETRKRRLAKPRLHKSFAFSGFDGLKIGFLLQRRASAAAQTQIKAALTRTIGKKQKPADDRLRTDRRREEKRKATGGKRKEGGKAAAPAEAATRRLPSPVERVLIGGCGRIFARWRRLRGRMYVETLRVADAIVCILEEFGINELQDAQT